MIEFRGHLTPVSLQDFTNEEKIFFLVSYQQHR